MKKNILKGFTLIEVLLVIAILAILATITIVAINPSKQLGEAQDAQRRNDVRAILSAVRQFSIDNNGQYPETLEWGNSCLVDGYDICQTEVDCDGINLQELAQDGLYLNEIPSDPSASSPDLTGYKMLINSNERVEVCAPSSYSGEPITVVQ